MNKNELHTYLISRNYVQDSWGNYRKGNIRVKLQSRTIRFERGWKSKVDNKQNWTLIAGGYYGKISLNNENKLVGLGRDY